MKVSFLFWLPLKVGRPRIRCLLTKHDTSVTHLFFTVVGPLASINSLCFFSLLPSPSLPLYQHTPLPSICYIYFFWSFSNISVLNSYSCCFLSSYMHILLVLSRKPPSPLLSFPFFVWSDCPEFIFQLVLLHVNLPGLILYLSWLNIILVVMAMYFTSLLLNMPTCLFSVSWYVLLIPTNAPMKQTFCSLSDTVPFCSLWWNSTY